MQSNFKLHESDLNGNMDCQYQMYLLKLVNSISFKLINSLTIIFKG
jgi:hypothetical protein